MDALTTIAKATDPMKAEAARRNTRDARRAEALPDLEAVRLINKAALDMIAEAQAEAKARRRTAGYRLGAAMAAWKDLGSMALLEPTPEQRLQRQFEDQDPDKRQRARPAEVPGRDNAREAAPAPQEPGPEAARAPGSQNASPGREATDAAPKRVLGDARNPAPSVATAPTGIHSVAPAAAATAAARPCEGRPPILAAQDTMAASAGLSGMLSSLAEAYDTPEERFDALRVTMDAMRGFNAQRREAMQRSHSTLVRRPRPQSARGGRCGSSELPDVLRDGARDANRGTRTCNNGAHADARTPNAPASGSCKRALDSPQKWACNFPHLMAALPPSG